MNVGDIIYCHTRVNDIYIDDIFWTTINKGYEIIRIDDDAPYKFDYIKTHNIVIINDEGGEHSFSLQKNDDDYWKKWFYDLRELRKNKLKQIESRR